MEILYILLVAAALVAAWLIVVYNGIIKLKNRTDESWSDIDVQLKRRYDLIPNLVETVKGYAKHEKELFENVTKARTAAMGAQGARRKGEAENMLTGALKSLFAVAENYPQLKASENFAKLQDELSDTENKVQAARRFYNGNVKHFNTKVQIFPNNLVVRMLKFKAYDFFEADGKERGNIKVRF
jgi:LemA protein